MRILHVISSPASGGAEVYVKDLVLELKEQGYFVAIAFLNHAIDVGRSQEYEDLFLSELQAANIPYFFIGYEARTKPWLGVLRVRKFVKDNTINIYHSHLPYGVVFSLLLKIPCVYTHHSINPRMNRFQYFIFNKIIDRYIGISIKCSEKLEMYTGEYVETIPNGINFSKIKTKLFDENNDKKIKGLAVGRLHPHKNYLFMIDAISRLPENLKLKFHLNIAGEGAEQEKKQIIDAIEGKGLGGSITLLGNRSDIPDLLADSDLFLMSSVQEGLPIALIEATAAGLPCLVTDVGGCSEVIESCENGFFVDKNNIRDYVNKLTELISDQSLRARLSKNALSKSNIFSIQNSVNKHVEVYSQIVTKE